MEVQIHMLYALGQMKSRGDTRSRKTVTNEGLELVSQDTDRDMWIGVMDGQCTQQSVKTLVS